MDDAAQVKSKKTSVKVRSLDDASRSDLGRAWRRCSRMAKQQAGNFYYAFIFLPTEQRRGIEALYAFCRAGDDAVDDEQDDSTSLLQRLRHKLDICYRGCYIDDLTLTLAHAVREFNFDRQHFDDLLLGIESDLTVKRYTTFEDLRLYCYRVASTIGLLCLQIFGCDNPQSRLYAENLGLGMQLTNILRDIREDFERDRIYIPLEDLESSGILDEELFSPSNAHRLKELVRWEAERAESFFSEADSYLEPGMRRKLFAAAIMGAIYRRILSEIINLDQFDHRAELSGAAKLSIARRIFNEAFL